MENLAFESAGNEIVINEGRHAARHAARSASKRSVKRLLVSIVLVVEIAACVYCCYWIFNDSMGRIFAFKGKTASVDIVSNSALPASSAIAVYEAYIEETRYKGPVLTKSRGTITGPSGKETYYNLNMSGVVNIMRRMGNTDEYWVREDGVKMLGDYVMVAANLDIRPRGSLVETSLGTAVVCDTGTFARRDPTQIDIAVTW